MNVNIAVKVSNARTAQLASELQLPAITEQDPTYEFILLEVDEQLTLCWQYKKKPINLSIDFLHGALAYRQKQHLHGEAIAKAVGIKGAYRPWVIDATAGLGRDAFILASLGCKLTLLERNPIVGSLLADALQRLLNQQNLAMELFQGEAIPFLAGLAKTPEVIYLDPMFPPRNKTALVKKDMQILQRLTENQCDDNLALLEIALRCAQKRVVVKRPAYAPPLGDLPANFAIKTAYHRFDVYLTAET